MADDKKEAQYAPPNSQLDLEARQERGNASDKVLSTSDEAAERAADAEVEEGRDFRVEGNDTSAYVNTDPVYQNYASDTEKPLGAEDGPEKKLEEFVAEQETTLLGESEAKPAAESSDDEQEEKESEGAEAASSSSSGSSTKTAKKTTSSSSSS